MGNGGSLEDALKQFNYDMNASEPDYWNRRSSYTQYKDQGQNMLTDFAYKDRWTENNIIASEHKFMIDIGEHQLSGIVDALSFPKDVSSLDIIDWKGLALDTPMATPNGWTTMADVRVGDQLFGSDGLPCTVTAKSQIHYNPTYKIIFDDKSEIVCDHEHKWKVRSGIQTIKDNILTTIQIKDSIFDTNVSQPQRQHRIVNVAPLDLPDIDLPIHPYVLGYWLGDGKHSSGEITSGDYESFSKFEELGYEVGVDNSTHRRIDAPNCETRTIYGILGHLKSLGVIKNKHIPELYLRSSINQRLDLLRGLMDSDGTWNKTRNQCEFTSTRECLTDGLLELVYSLGWRASKWSGKYSGFGVTGTQYRANFAPYDYNPFLLSRKADLVNINGTPKSRRRLIVDIIEIPVVPTQCITVDSYDSTYLCGNQMLPTHNTGSRPTNDNLRLDVQFTAYEYASYQKEFWCGYPGKEDYYSGMINGEELWERFKDIPRRTIWYDLKKNQDVIIPPHNNLDYGRLYRSMEQISRAVDLEVFVPNISGDSCSWCSYQEICPVYFDPIDKVY